MLIWLLDGLALMKTLTFGCNSCLFLKLIMFLPPGSGIFWDSVSCVGALLSLLLDKNELFWLESFKNWLLVRLPVSEFLNLAAFETSCNPSLAWFLSWIRLQVVALPLLGSYSSGCLMVSTTDCAKPVLKLGLNSRFVQLNW